MKALIAIIASLNSLLAFGGHAEANVLGSSCAAVYERGPRVAGPDDWTYSNNIILLVAAGGRAMSCETAKAVEGVVDYVKIAVQPAAIPLLVPGVREMLASELAAVGLTLASPVVLGVTVIGAFGAVTFYFVAKITLEDCQRAEVQEMIRREVEVQIKAARGKQIEFSR